MTKTEQGVRWVGVVAAVFLLPSVIGCTATLDHTSPQTSRKARVGSEAATAAEAPAAAESVAAIAPEGSEGALTDVADGGVTSAPAEQATEPLEPTLRVYEVGLTQRDGQAALAVSFSRPPDDVRHFALSNPNRLVLDVAGPRDPGTKMQRYVVGDVGVDRLRIGEYGGRLRVVADLSGPLPADYQVARAGRAVLLVLPSAAPVDERVVYLAPGVLPEELGARNVARAPTDDPAPTDETASNTAAATETPDQVPPASVAGGSDAPESAEITSADASDAAVASDDTYAREFASTEHDPPAAKPSSPAEVAAARDDVTDAASPKSDDDPTYVLPVQEAEGKERQLVVAGAEQQFTGQRISLDFKDADIQNVLRILADVSGLNIITTEDVSGKLTIRLMDVPWDQALGAILKAQGLDMVRDGNIVRISTVEKLKEERDAQRAADEAQKQAEPLKVHYVRVNYAKADEALVKKVQEVLTERGTATWDERTNTIVVRDIERGIVASQELIAEFDTQTPQVLIEANIVEATENFVRDLGIQWGYTYRASPEIGNAPGTNFPGTVKAGGTLAGPANSPANPLVPFIADFPAAISPGSGAAYDFLLGSLDGAHSLNARLTALERQGQGKVISRPRVVTLNNLEATIESLEILRVKLPSTGTVISTGAGGAAGAAQNATEQIRTGITLKVTPQVSSDGYIFLDVYAKSSALQDPTQSQAPSPDGIPNEISREAESHVLIKDGETFVLGGVFRNVLNKNDRGVPFLSDIPVLGWAFKNRQDIDNRQELLVFVTPRAVRARGSENLASLPSAESLWQNRNNP